MSNSIQSLLATGTKLWVDSVDPGDVKETLALGGTGATSNPILISGLINTGQYDDELTKLMGESDDDAEVAWKLTDHIIKGAQEKFRPIFEQTKGDDGYVSFELDPLLEAGDCPLSTEERTAKYIELGKKWSAGHQNRMIKVPATPAGLGALEELAALGLTLNVTLIFTPRQYEAARDAIWKGAQKRESLDNFKSVYSVFVSRVDVYTQKHLPDLAENLQGHVAMANAQLIWDENRKFWADKGLKLSQEMIFASTGVKDPNDPADKFNSGLAGGDIQTVPPESIQDIKEMEGKVFKPLLHELPEQSFVDQLYADVDYQKMEDVLMEEGLKKFADPQKALLAKIAEKRAALTS
ncbi:Transaldolase [Polystyrenella longa]|uniref:Transaldolase n=1 Tax=Polystyrenella longa TaxID=2528007 RepID=A0A518CHM9_9PLAN|nr:transaldolase family protein [Polystyrenella longa]QDU78732.1 Transaldolase [Polystyrenella longa]